MARILMITGPSGIGKSSVVRELMNKIFTPVLMTTTRQKRKNEVNGRDYEFLSEEVYLKKVRESDDFFMHNNFFGSYYGIRRSAVDNACKNGIAILVIYIGVIEQFIRQYPDSIKILLMPIYKLFLKERILKRDGTELRWLEVERELESCFKKIELFDTVVVIKKSQKPKDVAKKISKYVKSKI